MACLPNEIIQHIASFTDLTTLYYMMLSCKNFNRILKDYRILRTLLSNHIPYFKDCTTTDIEYFKDCIAFYQHNKTKTTLGNDLRFEMDSFSIYVIPHFL